MPIRPPSCRPSPGRSMPSSWCAASRANGLSRRRNGSRDTSRRPDELLVEARFPTAGRGTGVSFQEVARRHGDFAIVGLAASLTLAEGVISDARLAFAGLSDVPVRAGEAEDLLVGERPSAELFDEAA